MRQVLALLIIVLFTATAGETKAKNSKFRQSHRYSCSNKSQVPSSTAEVKSPDLNLILQRLEDVQHQDPAQSRPYEVTREYKVFRGDDSQPTSEVTAQINFVPPDIKTYKITQA
jgi:hypothetical protein